MLTPGQTLLLGNKTIKVIQWLGGGHCATAYSAQMIDENGTPGEVFCLKEETSQQRAGHDLRFSQKLNSEGIHLPVETVPGIFANTYYYGIPFHKGITLETFLERLQASNEIARLATQAGRRDAFNHLPTLDDLNLIAQKLIEAIIACHEQGILHRDIKPNNIIVDNVGRTPFNPSTLKVSLIDLANAVELSATPEEKSATHFKPALNYSPSTTISQFFMPQLAPEHCAARRSTEVSEAADVYAAGQVVKQIFNIYPQRSNTTREQALGLQHLVECMTTDNPCERLTLKEVKTSLTHLQISHPPKKEEHHRQIATVIHTYEKTITNPSSHSSAFIFTLKKLLLARSSVEIFSLEITRFFTELHRAPRLSTLAHLLKEHCDILTEPLTLPNRTWAQWMGSFFATQESHSYSTLAGRQRPS